MVVPGSWGTKTQTQKQDDAMNLLKGLRADRLAGRNTGKQRNLNRNISRWIDKELVKNEGFNTGLGDRGTWIRCASEKGNSSVKVEQVSKRNCKKEKYPRISDGLIENGRPGEMKGRTWLWRSE